MTAETQKLVDGETMGRADREREIREAIERIFAGGVPLALVVMVDTGKEVKTQCVGPIVDLRALLLAGATQCASMLDNAVEPVPKRLDS